MQNPDYKGKIKQVTIRNNYNMLDIHSTKAKIATNFQEKCSSLSQTILIVDKYHKRLNLNKVTQSLSFCVLSS